MFQRRYTHSAQPHSTPYGSQPPPFQTVIPLGGQSLSLLAVNLPTRIQRACRDEGGTRGGMQKMGDESREIGDQSQGVGYVAKGWWVGPPTYCIQCQKIPNIFIASPLSIFFIICDTASSLIDVVRIACTYSKWCRGCPALQALQLDIVFTHYIETFLCAHRLTIINAKHCSRSTIPWGNQKRK